MFIAIYSLSYYEHLIFRSKKKIVLYRKKPDAFSVIPSNYYNETWNVETYKVHKCCKLIFLSQWQFKNWKIFESKWKIISGYCQFHILKSKCLCLEYIFLFCMKQLHTFQHVLEIFVAILDSSLFSLIFMICYFNYELFR